MKLLLIKQDSSRSLLLLLLPALLTVVADSSILKTDLFILGCNGDLAQRYLWPAFRQVWQQQQQQQQPPNQPLELHCVTRGSLSADNPGAFLATAEPGLRDWFFANVRLHAAVRDEAGYRSLCSQAEVAASRRIFYLSIPPRSYAEVAGGLQRACPQEPGGPVSEFVLEKPFGSSAASAEQLASELTAVGVTEERLHRVDHYLAKPVLAALTQFRQANPHLESLLSSAYVTRVKAAIWENLGVEDRLDFYDSEGVIRDVMQNHLTEMLNLVLMELPPSQPPPDWLENEKSRLLSAYCPPVGARHLLAGRYSGYGGSRMTPTFAAVGLTLCGRARWQSVPIVASAGKRLAFKASFIQLTFQLPATATGRSEADELLVYVGGDAKATGLARPLIACSAGLRCRASADLRALPSNEALVNPGLVDQTQSQTALLRLSNAHYSFFSVSKSSSENAYVQVAKQLLANKTPAASPASSCFVGLPSLLAAWQLWDPVLAVAAELAVQDDDGNGFRVYQSNWLPDFTVDRLGRLDWSVESEIAMSVRAADATTSSSGAGPPKWVRFDRTLCDGLDDCSFLVHSGSPQSLSCQLAERIAFKIKAAAAEGDERSDFHLALPGGQSAQLLMQCLATRARDDGSLADAIGQFLHVWLTDERCVQDDPDVAKLKSSNLNSAVIDRHFLRLLPLAARLPLSRIHLPRPGSDEAAGCMAASAAYSSEVNLWLRDRSGFDFVVLGVGADGHSASLFTDRDFNEIDCGSASSTSPDADSSSSGRTEHTDCLSQSARFTSSPQAPQHRVSLTASEIARSNEVAFVLTGAAKQAALDTVVKTSLLNAEKPVYFRLLRLVGKDRGRLWIDKSLNYSGLVSL